MTLKYYTQDDFNKILFDNCNITLSNDIIEIIKQLDLIISETIPSTSNTIVQNTQTDKYSKKTTVDNKRKPNKYYSKDIELLDDWKSTHVFKATKLEVKEGTDKIINDIRVALNKLSTKNMEIQKTTIIQLIQQVMSETQDADVDIKRITDIIFEIASSNKFYSELYADLYYELMADFSALSNKLTDLLEKYKESLHQIVAVDPNVDYDGFCNYTKKNDLRKAMLMFIVNIAKKGLLKEDDLLNITLYLEDMVFKYAEEPNRSNELEELTENIFIIITQSKKFLMKSVCWNQTIIPNITTISKMKKTNPEKYVSMTNRAVFKFMDIIDNINKN
jgi:hypothetical protein